MITLEQIKEEQEKVNELVRKYEEQEEQEKQKKKYSNKLEYPETGEVKFFVNAVGGIEEIIFNSGYMFEFEQGHLKDTEKEADIEVERRELMARFNQFRDKCNGDWKPDFEDNHCKYYISFNDGRLKPYWTIVRDFFIKFGYFKNPQDCEKAIELFGEEIKELF